MLRCGQTKFRIKSARGGYLRHRLIKNKIGEGIGKFIKMNHSTYKDKKMNKNETKKLIDELEKILLQEQRNVEKLIVSSAPQSFCDDMNGCARGLSMARNIAIGFLKEKL